MRQQEPDAPTAVAPPSTRRKTTSDVEVRACAGCSIELTGAHRNECGRFNECALCKERRIPKPALYCGRSCALQHWKKGHKEWHEKVKVISDDMASNSRIYSVRACFCRRKFSVGCAKSSTGFANQLPASVWASAPELIPVFSFNVN